MPLLHFNLSMASCSTWNKIQTIITCEVFYVLTPEFLSALISYHSAHYAPLTLASFLCLKHTELSPLQAGLCPECFSCSSSHGWLIAASSSSFRPDQISPCQKIFPNHPVQKWSCVHVCAVLSCSVVSDSLRPHGLLGSCPWNCTGKNPGVGCHFLFQGTVLTQGLNLCLLYWQANSLPLCHLGNPRQRGTLFATP